MAFNPGDIVKIVGMQDYRGNPTNEFGGNGGLGTVQGVSFHPQSSTQWVHVKCLNGGPIFQLPAANVQAAVNPNPALPLPGVLSYWSKPNHHNITP
jgi:hypothetical protein